MRDNGDFFTDLRKEINQGQERRGGYIKAKFGFLVAIFAFGSLEITNLPNGNLLYLVTLVVFVYDLYIIGEDFSVKRAGRFLLMNPNVPGEEQRWEKTVNANRDPVSKPAGFSISFAVLIAAAVGLWPTQSHTLFFWIWIFINVLLLAFIVWYGHQLVHRMKKLVKFLNNEFGLTSDE